MVTGANCIDGIQIHNFKGHANHRNTKQMRHVTVQRGGRLLEMLMQWGGGCFPIRLRLYVKTNMDRK